MAKTSTKKKCHRKSGKSYKKCRSKSQQGGGLFWSSDDEKIYAELKKQLTPEEYKKFTPYKEQIKNNLKTLIDASSKIDYKEMLKSRINTHLIQKLGTCRANSTRNPIEQCLQTLIPANINLTEILNKQIDAMLGSTQPSQYQYPYSSYKQ